jgi:dihydroorotate dehydrogenase
MVQTLSLFRLLRPALFALEPERAHMLAIGALERWPRRAGGGSDAALAMQVAGLTFPNPVGVAAGFDKNAQVPDPLLALGFGFTEVGTITPRPQSGNPRPRLFRLAEDEGVINRMGFNNAGAAAALGRLQARRERGGIVGVNIGANKEAEDRIADYAMLAETFAPVASYLAINVSSPNTPGLRALQDETALTELVARVLAARDTGSGNRHVPVFLKVAPDLEPSDIDAIARIAMEGGLDALIVSNTTIARPRLRSRHAGESGGLSGAPLRIPALAMLRAFRAATGGELPLIGVGGIATAEDAWERIRAGASLIQLYSAMVYRGPGLGGVIARQLPALMRRDGFATIAEAVGSE